MATFTITSTADTAGDTSNGTPGANGNASGTLRQAINFANQNVGNPSIVTTIRVASGLSGAITLNGNLPLVATSINLNGGGLTLDGASSYRGFLVSGIAADGRDAAPTTVGISNLMVRNVLARGGAGGNGGGGGLGAGGAVFVGPKADVTLTNVTVTFARAVGGVGGSGYYNRGSGGGGGLAGNGGSGSSGGVDRVYGPNGGGGGLLFNGGNGGPQRLTGSGGGGITSGGASGTYQGGGAGGSGLGGLGGGGGGGGGGLYATTGGPGGGVGAGRGAYGRRIDQGGDGGFGGFGGGGGGGGPGGASAQFRDAGGGGTGGFGAGGGGGGDGATGGAGGFGGGGGLGDNGGAGGFGGGGGGAAARDTNGGYSGGTGGAGGFGGGAGGGLGFGGSGAAMGGAIFVAAGGRLSVAGTFGASGGEVTGGAGTYGAGIFYEGGSGTPAVLSFGAGDQTVVDAITDLNGASSNTTTANGFGGFGGITALAKTGSGRLTLFGSNSYTGGTQLNAGTLELRTLNSAGLGAITFGAAAQTLQLDTAGALLGSLTGFGLGDVIDLRTVDPNGASVTSSFGFTIFSEANGSDSNALAFSSLPSGYTFSLTSNGAGGTKVMLRPVAPTLAAASDTGISSTDRITNDTTPTFTGITGAGTKVTLYDGSTVVGTATAGSNGAYSVTSSARGQGVHSFKTTVTDPAGTVTAASPVTTVTIDSTKPATLAKPALAAAYDTGQSSTDGITRSTTLVFTGRAEAGSTVTLLDRSTTVGTVATASNGTYRFVLSGVAQGAHSYKAYATDKAGNLGSASAATNVTIDTTKPGTPTKPDLPAAYDTGSSSTDGLTKSTRIVLTGTAEAGSTVTLLDGATQVGSLIAATNGAYRFDLTGVAEGAHRYIAYATDKAGNVGPRTAATAVTVDTTAPEVAITSPGGAATRANQTLTGTGEAGTTITVSRNGTTVGTATVLANGTWSRNVTLASGSNRFVATDTDKAGNVGTSTAVTYSYTPAARQMATSAPGNDAHAISSATHQSSFASVLFDATFSPASSMVAPTHSVGPAHPVLAAPS